jgi:DNA helicase-2/ATP-dependent DNA helicase PcrA
LREELYNPSTTFIKANKFFENSIYNAYINLMSKLNYTDYSDILYRMVNIFKINADTLDYCQKFYSHFNADEFQDINYSQYMFLKYLTVKSSSFFVVGDDNQSLYS